MCRRSPILCALTAFASLAVALPAIGATGEILLQTDSEPGIKCVTSPATFDVLLQVANLSDAVNGVQARFSYDPALMTLNSSTEAAGWSLISLTNSPAGIVTYAAINNSGGSFGPGAGPFTVATLHFTSVAQGTTSITFRADSPPLLTKLTTTGMDPQTISGGDLAKIDSGSIAIDLPTAPTSAAVDRNNFCSDDAGDISLTATGGAGTTLAWYTGSCGGSLVGTGSPLVLASPTTTTTYYARWEHPCGNSSCASVTVTVNSTPVAPTSALVDTPTYCSDAVPATIELTATGGSGDTLQWYSGSCGGVSVGSGSPLVIAAPAGTTTYYARWETSLCGNSTCASVTVTVNASPVAPTSASVDSPTYCSGSAPATIELTATGGSGDTMQWYSGSCGGVSVGSGSPLIIAAPAGTTTYYARWETTLCGNSTCASVTVTVNASPVAPSSASVDAPMYCSDAVPATIELTATGGSGDTLQWYSGSCGGVSVGSGSPLIIAAPASTTTYYARWETSLCGNSTCASVTVTVNPTPVAPTSAGASPMAYCADAVPATIDLMASGGSGDTLEWFSGSCGGTAVGTGSPLTIAAPTSTTTYYVRWTNGCGNSTCASVTVTVNPVPAAPTAANVDSPSYCSNAVPATIELTASGGSGDTLEWFSGSCGGTSVGTGTPLVIAAPTSTTTYHVRWTNGCGSSTCANVTVTVTAAPTANAGSNQTVCAGAVVHLSGSAGNFSSVAWSGGTGTFDPNNTSLLTDYTPSAAETLAGTVTLTLTAFGNGPCANATSQMTITIQPCITVNLQVPGLIGTVAESAQVCQRSVEFVITACPGAIETRTPTVTFSRSGSNGVGQVVMTNVNASTDSIAVREGHTLRKLVNTDLSGDLNDTVSVTLTSGDFQTTTVPQDNLVDIVDFSILASRWNTIVSDCGVGPSPQNCSRGADSNGDGVQDTTDFNAIQINFFATGDSTSNCPPPFKWLKRHTATSVALDFLVNEHQVRAAKASIRVSDLAFLMPGGVRDAMSADVNSDGIVDLQDIRDFAFVNNLPLMAEFEEKASIIIGQ